MFRSLELLFLFHAIIQIRAEDVQVVKFSVKEESVPYTTIGNISSYLLPKPRITTDSLFFNVTSTGLVQLTKRLDLEALCTEKFLCCQHEKPCELVSTLVVESLQSRDLRTLELRVQVLDINDNVPVFQFNPRGGQHLEISELAKVGSVFDVSPATDKDVSKENQVQRYMLHGPELQQVFQLEQSDVPSARLTLIKQLDYEQTPRYTGLIEACDPQNCVQQNLTILIVDANDNHPRFIQTSYEVSIPENYTVGHTVLRLVAEDKDSPTNARMEFRYHGKTDSDLQNTFRLEPDTGRLVLRAHLAAHRRSEYRFEVIVLEKSFDNSIQSIHESSSPVSSGSQTATTGNIASVRIRIEDLNDFSPTIKLFSPAEGERLSILENTPSARVCVLQVTDNDAGENGRVSCQLVKKATPLDLPLILTGSGKMYTLSTTRALDAEKEPQINVAILCNDHGEPSRTTARDFTIHIDDVNEFVPELEKTMYHATIQENSPPGVEVVKITALDRDHNTKLHYKLSAEGNQYFQVDSQTGSVITLGDQVVHPLDREKSERITFSVCVSDGPMQDYCDESTRSSVQGEPIVHVVRATVVVTILDQNDNRPEFLETGPFSVAENQPRYTQLSGKLLATDPDEGDNGKVRYNLRHVWRSVNQLPSPDLFQIDPTGQIQTLEVLDREVTNLYTLEVSACDSARPTPLCTRINVTVSVLDENDNKPVWRYPHDHDKEVNITNDLPSGHIIARVHATDRDADENGRVVYSLIDPLRRTVFQVDNKTGDISVAGTFPKSVIDTENPSPLLPGIYRLRMKATDLGHPQQVSETWLQVNVFSADSGVTGGMNFMIIVVMVAVTGLVSICLVVAIICVRRRSVALRANPTPMENGFRHGRDAADGAEGVHFPLKQEYGYPIDGYMMGVSPTPSDLDGFKIGYPQSNTIPYLGLPNGNPDAAHLIGWPTGTVCYQSDDPYISETAIPTEMGHAQPIRFPVYAPYQIKSLNGSDHGTMRSGSINGCPSINCANFNGPLSESVPSSSVMQTFTAAAFTEPSNSIILDDGTLMCELHSRNSVYDIRQPPSSSTAPINANRRYLPHCEFDVDSADSGRGPSEDDPGMLTHPTGIIHVYPTMQFGGNREYVAAAKRGATDVWNSNDRPHVKC